MVDRTDWTVPPAVPRSYRLGDRWSDYRWARADARKGIPLVARRPEPATIVDNGLYPAPVADSPPIRESDAAAAVGEHLPVGVQYPPPGAYEPADEAMALVTPYMDGLRHTCNEAIAVVYEHFESSCDQLRESLSRAEIRRETLSVHRATAQARFDELADPLNNEQATRARRGESDWPPEMVRVRREREWREARSAAEEELRGLSADLRAAEVDLDHARRAYQSQLRRSQALGWQIFHHYARREAIYIGVLARKHKRGPELVRLLRLTGPDLPEWLLTIDGKEEG